MFSTLAHDSIALHYQPLAECGGGVVGFEALMRWHHQRRGAISPEAFIPIFENSGLMLPLSRWALNQACLEAASWAEPLIVSANLSAVQFEQEDLPDLVREALERSGLSPERLELEVTGAAMQADPGKSLRALQALRELGIGLALDDFGTERSTPEHARDFPFSKIKIDGSFVAGIESSASARAVIHMVIELGHSRHLTVAAKGVETHSQFGYLQDQGCDLIQGFLIGRPAPASEFGVLTGALAEDAPASSETEATSEPGRRPVVSSNTSRGASTGLLAGHS